MMKKKIKKKKKNIIILVLLYYTRKEEKVAGEICEQHAIRSQILFRVLNATTESKWMW